MAQVAVLFWFYRDLPVCRNRLALLRRDNPGTPIFGLYGGDPAHEARFRAALAPELDDFWGFDQDRPAQWKWRHGDLMLAAWYEARGRALEWDHVFVAQWDLLVLEPLATLLPPLAGDELVVSGVRPVAAIEPHWNWARGGHRPEYDAFVSGARARFGPDVEPLSCVFVIAVLPRRLFAAYQELPSPETGFVEYRLPTLAAATGLRFVDDDRFRAWRPADVAAGKATRRERFLNGARRAIVLPTVLLELARRDGARLFHPYHGLFPLDRREALRAPGWAGYVAVRTVRDAVRARLCR
jgi:hypothetical protein